MDVLKCFPPLMALGRQRLQQLCDEWVKTPVAKEFSVIEMRVGYEATGFALNPRIDLYHAVQDGEGVRFPMDDLLTYLLAGAFVCRCLTSAPECMPSREVVIQGD